MQLTTKFAVLATVFGATAFALPFAADYDLEAREVDSDLSAREYSDMYLEARTVPDALELESREYLEDLEARAATSVSLIPCILSLRLAQRCLFTGSLYYLYSH